jgi:predicted ATPase/class 3 adenylate cyclase
MHDTPTLLLTDVVDSTQLNEQLGDAEMARLWAAHDSLARSLLRDWQGTEVGRSDGFLLLFDAPAQALGFALDYHRALQDLPVPMKARVGLHTGPVTLRENRHEDTARGATPFEVDGVALPVAARTMSAALGGQTLLTAATVQALGPVATRLLSHGHWRLKGLAEPIELFEAGDGGAPFVPPPDAPKAYRVVRAGDGWTTAQQLPNNLPAQRDAFIGRLAPLDALAGLFDGGARLVTVLGIGGIGKTRLALSHARSWLGNFPGGAWFCDLKAARSLDGIASAVAQGLEMPLGRGDPVQQLGAAIAGRGACLVILDNFEQVARHAEATLGAWLERAPAASFVVTSREVLGIAGEQTLVLSPLSAPEAVQMFRHRVRAAGPAAPLDAEDERAIPLLMDILDRLPLAIELAAARVRVMPPRVLLQRMGERFKVLAARGGRQDRQATMRATLDWSWELLSAAERSVLMQLAVFEGGIAMEAAEAVVAASSIDGDAWVPDLLQALVEKSLLTSLGAQRFDMLRTVHDYAAERLAASELAAGAAQRHWRYFAALTEAQAVAGRGVEVDNVVVACRRAAELEATTAVALLRNAWAALRLRGPFQAGAELGLAVEAVLPAADPQRAVVDRVVGAALWLLGDAAGARGRCAAALQRATEPGSDGNRALTQCLLAELELAAGNREAAAQLLDEAQRSPAAQADPGVRSVCLNGLGNLHWLQSHWQAARSCFTEALQLAETVGDGRQQGGLHGNLGMIARAEGRLDEARHHWQTGLEWAREVGDRQWEGNTHCNLGLLLNELGDSAAAGAELQAALEAAQAMGHRRLEATVLCNLGLVAEARGEMAAANGHHAQAVLVAQALGDSRLEGQLRGYLGLTLALLNRPERAAGELQNARELLQPHGDPSAMALLLLQSAVAAASRRDAAGCAADIGSAVGWMARMSDGVDPEIAALRARAESLLAGLVARAA